MGQLRRTLHFLCLLGLSAGCLAASDSTDRVLPGEESIAMVRALGFTTPDAIPDRGDESEGPYERLVITGAILIDGTGAPPRGPVNIVIEDDRIVLIAGAGTGSGLSATVSTTEKTRVIDATGQYVLPGFIDAHVHFGTPTHAVGGALTNPEYVSKLFLGHGITTVRDAGALMGLRWTLAQKARSDAGEIAAPRMQVYAMLPETTASPEAARNWISSVHEAGADGIKLIGAAPEVVEAAINQAGELGMRTAYHHSQISVARADALDSARLGLTSIEHWYGLPEAMFTDRTTQDFPADYNYGDEQSRFRAAGDLWQQTAAPGSARWKDTIDALIEHDTSLVPTFSVYEANRDLMRARNKEWHADYTMPYMQRAFSPNTLAHGSYHFDWGTEDETAWKHNYALWMRFVRDFKNAGGRVAAGADSGFIYSVYGFGYIRELELLREAGFLPLEVISAATLNGAELLGLADDTGSVEVGKKADLIITRSNPLKNLKTLYGTGHYRLNADTGRPDYATSLRYTIKDGIVFNSQSLLRDVRALVAAAKDRES